MAASEFLFAGAIATRKMARKKGETGSLRTTMLDRIIRTTSASTSAKDMYDSACSGSTDLFKRSNSEEHFALE